MHRADPYVGLSYAEHGREITGVDCWGLYRLVIGELTGHWAPRYDSKDGQATFEKKAPAHRDVAFKDAKELDAVIMNVEVREHGRWVLRPLHIGVFFEPDMVLHIREGMTSRIDKLSDVKVAGFKARPA